MTRRPSLPTVTRATGVAAIAALLLAACGGSGTTTGAKGATSKHYPVTVSSCGRDVSIPAPPERTVLLKSASVPYLADLGALDRVTARAGQYPSAYFDEDTNARLADIPSISDRTDSSGHLIISKESVLEREPDLVMGLTDTVDPAALDPLGIPLLEVEGLCPEGIAEPSFEDVWSQMRTYGQVFDAEEAAERAITALQERLRTVTASVDPAEERTAAVLYPTVGGGSTYAYGQRSMAQPQLEAAGLTNVFADVDERVFEVTLETLLEADPDVVILLHSDGDAAPVEQALTDLPGADRLTAVSEGAVMTQLFNFTEPPTPLAVDGLERIVERFGRGR